MRQRFGYSASSRAAYGVSRSRGDELGTTSLQRVGAKQLREQIDLEMEKARKRKADCLEEDGENSKKQHGAVDSSDPQDDDQHMQDVLEGNTLMETSHAGGEMFDILWQDTDGDQRPAYFDTRSSRKDRLEVRTEEFCRQMPEMVEAFMRWQAHSASKGLNSASPLEACARGHDESPDPVSELKLEVVDVFYTQVISTGIDTSCGRIPAELISRGMIPSAPIRPTTAISTRTLEYYRNAISRCPHLSVEAFLKSLSDLHGRVYRPHLAKQFTIAYDVFLQLHHDARRKVLKVIGRDTHLWRLKNVCSACTYKLEDEAKLKFSILTTMDGNDSLKRILRKSVEELGDGNTATTINEIDDSRQVVGDYYLTRDAVNHWARTDENGEEDLRLAVEDSDNNPCASRWKNMMTDKTSRMWSVFDETGIFLSLCRHGHALLVADMVQSGEQAKYPLAIIDVLLEAFGSDIGAGYDIGCRFSTTVARSNLATKARELNYTSLVGSFHGHAHNRLCQLSNLATYVEGIGLEDLEGCERFFSKSNAMASSTRYASRFHRQQKIAEFLRHMDAFEVSQTLSSTFLVNNYKQALNIIAGEATLIASMREHNIENPEVFKEWLAEEREHLQGLSKEPIQETLEMDYYLHLVELEEHQANKSSSNDNFVWVEPSTNGKGPYRAPKGTVTALVRRHAREWEAKCLADVQEDELRLGVEERWTKDSEEWKRAKKMVAKREYQRCLDKLEGLVVSRVFELSKMNMSQSGYKLRKHVAKALRARSQAIKSALERYNEAATAMRPKRSTLTWEEVVEYAFLLDFDLLRELRQDIRDRPWARPAIRTLMDQYFKIQRAREEIVRLNVEIRRVITHIQDEEQFLLAREAAVADTDPILAYHVRCYRLEHTRFDQLHMRKFRKLMSMPGFSGAILPGTPQDKTLTVNIIPNTTRTSAFVGQLSDGLEGDEHEEENIEGMRSDDLRERLETMITVSF
ncbi:hypothetical protein NP233_g11436 [Leucocoprinus birnbaumii]|uniref:Uncharacterized protein n=1 Tax=Leucocoprinus birnbaumii TaxID=56174 RepID=A0AAD5VGK7_9AGAR|nr:hypothetical protein NP233_g11436 [Leucocoprinus birnbaumii]